MYHLELRKFPHSVCRFNQSEQEVTAIVVPWVNDEWIEQGERKWNRNEANLTVLEGPELTMSELAMGRGWRNAQRRSQDVTERVLAAVRAGTAGADTAPGGAHGEASLVVPPSGRSDTDGADDLLADSLGLELLALLDDGALAPARVWEVARIRLPGASAAESLALAERAVRSLLRRGLIVVRHKGDGKGGEGDLIGLTPEQAQDALAAGAAWTAEQGADAVVIARKA